MNFFTSNSSLVLGSSTFFPGNGGISQLNVPPGAKLNDPRSFFGPRANELAEIDGDVEEDEDDGGDEEPADDESVDDPFIIGS